ncbi:MAG: hypothetical protein FJ088_00365 [Deltaproteobacteria bacterium]|nr:hypothetical protein [Deltaproteobacteria bacterium]
MIKSVALIVLTSFTLVSCYNTYYISVDNLKTLQRCEQDKGCQNNEITLNSIENEPLLIKDDTKLFVRSKGGKNYPITPFNFKMTEQGQLVASDRDYLLPVSDLEENGEVKYVSTFKTAGLIALGVAAVTGLIIAVIVTSGQKSFGGD